MKYSFSQEISILKSETARHVPSAEEHWLIHVFSNSGERCVLLTPTFARFAISIGGIVKVGAIDITAEPHLLLRLGIQATEPGVWLVRPSSSLPGMSRAVRLNNGGGPVKEKEMLDFLEREIPYAGNAVRSEEAFNTWMKTHERLPRLLLMTNKPREPLLYKVLSIAFDQARSLLLLLNTFYLTRLQLDMDMWHSLLSRLNRFDLFQALTLALALTLICSR